MIPTPASYQDKNFHSSFNSIFPKASVPLKSADNALQTVALMTSAHFGDSFKHLRAEGRVLLERWMRSLGVGVHYGHLCQHRTDAFAIAGQTYDDAVVWNRNVSASQL